MTSLILVLAKIRLASATAFARPNVAAAAVAVAPILKMATIKWIVTQTASSPDSWSECYDFYISFQQMRCCVFSLHDVD